jgi:hypothetical protein
MFDSFLSDILQIIIVVDILAVIAYFTIGARRRKADSELPQEKDRAPDFAVQLEAVQHNRVSTSQVDAPLYERVTAHLRGALSGQRKRNDDGKSVASDSLETAFLNLRRVLTSYHQELA